MWTRLIILTVAALGLVGCFKSAQPGTVKTLPEPTIHEQQNQALEAKVRELNARIEEVSVRNTQLADQCVKLKLDNEQLSKQLAAIGPAPRERDQFRQQVGQLQQEIGRLQKLVEGLGGISTAPATVPAAEASQPPNEQNIPAPSGLPMPAGPLAAPRIVPVEPVPPNLEPTRTPEVGKAASEPPIGPAAERTAPAPGVLPTDQVKTFIINPPAATPDQPIAPAKTPEPAGPPAVPAQTITGTAGVSVTGTAAPAVTAPGVNRPRRSFGPEGVGVGVPIPPTTAPADPPRQTPVEGFVVEEK